MSRRDEFRSPQPSPLFPFACTVRILWNGHQQAYTEHTQATPKPRPQEVHEGLIPIDPVTQELMQPRIVVLHLLEHEPFVASFQSFLGECKGLLASGSPYRCHLFIECQSAAFPVHYIQHQITSTS